MKFKIFTMLVTLGIMSVVPMIYMGKFDPMAFFDSGISKGTAEFKNLIAPPSGLFAPQGKHGRPSLDIKANMPESLTNVVSDKKVQVYKWRDKNGVMQFSSAPPPTVTNAEAVLLDPNKNLVKAIKIPKKEEPKEVVKTQSVSPYSVSGMKKVMNDARGVEELLKKRHEQQQKMMNSL
jgi:hypothetical protein